MNKEGLILIDADIDGFDALFEGPLSVAAFQSLQLSLKDDVLYRYKFMVYRALRNEIEADQFVRMAIKTRLSGLEKNTRAGKASWKKAWVGLSLAASILLMVFLVLTFNKNTIGVQVYEQYKFAEPGFPITMDADNSSNFSNAMMLFAKEDYEESMQQLQTLPPSDTTQYYIAICNELLGNYLDVTEVYSTLKGSNSTFIAHKAEFRLALVQLQLNSALAKNMFLKIAADPTQAYQTQAKEILRLLSKQ